MERAVRHHRRLRATLIGGLLALAPSASAHDWYPLECCSEQDCAPADTVVRREDGSYLVTSRGMSVIIPTNYANWRKSPDARIHVCIRKLRSGSEYLICAFRGPGT
jgi:hypothetical protein